MHLIVDLYWFPDDRNGATNDEAISLKVLPQILLVDETIEALLVIAGRELIAHLLLDSS